VNNKVCGMGLPKPINYRRDILSMYFCSTSRSPCGCQSLGGKNSMGSMTSMRMPHSAAHLWVKVRVRVRIRVRVRVRVSVDVMIRVRVRVRIRLRLRLRVRLRFNIVPNA